jgi:predicted metal-dependent hydrolase
MGRIQVRENPKMKRSMLKLYQVGSTTVVVKSHGSSKSLRLKIDPITKTPVLTVPLNCHSHYIKRFLDQSQSWIMEHLAPFQGKRGHETVLYKGEPHQISLNPFGNANSVVGVNPHLKTIHLGCTADRVSHRLKSLFKKEALAYSQAQSSKLAQHLNVSFQKVMVKDYRARWGSCSSQGLLTFSWRLIQAPTDVFDYVCAHEVAHLIHLNHSPSFWQVVACLCPHYEESRQWLKTNGAQLFHYL